MLAALHRWEAVSQLCARLGSEPRQRVFQSYLDVALATTRAGAALVLDTSAAELALGAERGLVFGTPAAARVIRTTLHGLVRRVVVEREPSYIADLTRELPPSVQGDLFSAAYHSALIAPASHGGTAVAALVLLFDARRAEHDPELVAYVRVLCDLLAIALQLGPHLAADDDGPTSTDDANRLASLGLLTASVAHELRGPAGALVLQLDEQRRIVAELQQLGARGDDGLRELIAELAEITTDVERAVVRIRDTTGQLTTLSRRDDAPDELDLGELVETCLGVVRSHLERRGIELVHDLTRGCTISGRRDQLAQLVLNLAFNAADACETSGHGRARITVRVADEHDHVALQVEDTGLGVPDGLKARIFEPFYTTKPRGHGTGLGLKIVSDVAAAHGGRIEVRDLAEGGACFRITLPRVDAASGVHPVHDPQQAPRLRKALPRRHILLVDDDPIFCRTMRRTLKLHDVKTATTASEAEMALLDPSYVPDLVLCDMCLPGTNGDALHSRIAELRPELSSRFVFVTGGGLSKREHEYVQRVGCRTLLKPVDVDQLLHDLLEPPPLEAAPRRAAGSRPPRGG